MACRVDLTPLFAPQARRDAADGALATLRAPPRASHGASPVIERLTRALQALAAPADVQLARFPDFGAEADAPALDYADALLLALDCPQLRIEPAQRVALERLDARLDGLCGAANAGMWSPTALRDAPEWTAVRTLAAAALSALGAPHELPPAA